MLQRKILLLLGLLFSLGLFLRWYELETGLIFGYDQARDAYRSRSIIHNRDLKILGPETDIRGVHHGVGYYYLLAIPYAISGNPVLAARFMALLNALGIFLVYTVSANLFKNRKTALVASAYYTFSFEIIQYARWLSNPSLALLTVMVAFWGLWLWINKKQAGLPLAFLGIGLSLHFQFFLIYLVFVPIIIYFLYRPELKLKYTILSLVIFIFFSAPIIYSELKFNFQALRALTFFTVNQFQSHKSFFVFLLNFSIKYLDRANSVMQNTLFPAWKLNFGLLLIFLFLKLIIRRDKILAFLTLWLFSGVPLFFFSSGALTNEFSFVGSIICLIFMASYIFKKIFDIRRLKYVLFLLICVLFTINIHKSITTAKDGAYLFSVQGPMTFGLETALIDYTYLQAKSGPFTICTLTNPLFVNTTWAYLYEYYGLPAYGYLPFWSGSDQKYELGFLKTDTAKVDLRFLIAEPLIGLPGHAVEIFYQQEEIISEKIEARNFGNFTVDKRRLYSESESREKSISLGEKYLSSYYNPSTLLYRCYN